MCVCVCARARACARGVTFRTVSACMCMGVGR